MILQTMIVHQTQIIKNVAGPVEHLQPVNVIFPQIHLADHRQIRFHLIIFLQQFQNPLGCRRVFRFDQQRDSLRVDGQRGTELNQRGQLRFLTTRFQLVQRNFGFNISSK